MDLVKRFEQCVSEKEDIGNNLTAAWHYLVNCVKTTECPTDWGLLETSLVCDTHRVMFQLFPKGLTPPGKLSSRPRYCNLDDGNRQWYPVPDDMGEALTSLQDSYNARYDACRHQNDLFRMCAWLLIILPSRYVLTIRPPKHIYTYITNFYWLGLCSTMVSILDCHSRSWFDSPQDRFSDCCKLLIILSKIKHLKWYVAIAVHVYEFFFGKFI